MALAALAAFGAGAAANAAAPRATLERRFEAAFAAADWPLAAALADSAVRRRERSGGLSPERAAVALDSLGRRLFLAGDPAAWAAAEPLFRGALARRERTHGAGHPAVATSLATLSTLLDYLGRWAEAVPLAERAVAVRERALGAGHRETAAALRQLGLLRFQLGDYAGAEAPLGRALEIYAALGPAAAAQVADAHNNLGELARVRDRLGEAERHFQAGLAARTAAGDDDAMRLALANNLAGLFKDVGRYDRAEPLLERGLAALESAGDDPEGLATARLNLAEVRRLQGRAAEAAPLYAQALAGARSALGEGHPELTLFLNQSAVCEQELGRTARAESLYREAGAIIGAALGDDHPLLAQNLGDRARLRLALGAPAEAESLLERAIALRERSLGPQHPDVAPLLLDLARARTGSTGTPGPDAPLGRAIAILDSSPAHPEARLDAHALRAERHARAGRLEAAIADMAVALDAMDSLRAGRGGGDETRASFLAGRLGLIDRAVGWQLARGAVGEALAIHERGRARVLLDQIAANGVDLRAGIPEAELEPLVEAERAAEARLAAANRAIDEARFDPTRLPRERLAALVPLESRRDAEARALERARARIAFASPLWRTVLSAEGRIPSVEELRRALVPRDGLLLVYHVGAAESRVFVVPPRGPVEARALALDPAAAAALDAPPGPLGEATLERIVVGTRAPGAGRGSPGIADLLGGITAGGFVSLPLRAGAGPDSFGIRLHALWRALVPAALRPRLARARTTVIAPDGALHLIAFEALVTRPRRERSPVRYWLDDGPAIAYGPSATSLRSLALRPAPPAGRGTAPILSVSDVAYAAAPDPVDAVARTGRAWARLPGTALETEALRAAFGVDRVEVLTGPAAREAAVRAALPERRYLHLATHGFADDDAGGSVRAGLVLAPPAGPDAGSDDDGVLESFEIHRLRLDCRLAVLSACETAKGPRVAGEGAFALSRAFLAAGSRGVVASLWAVADRPTARAMGALFESLAAADARGSAADPARALRDAKRAVRRDPRWADPFYWAPFVFSGR